MAHVGTWPAARPRPPGRDRGNRRLRTHRPGGGAALRRLWLRGAAHEPARRGGARRGPRALARALHDREIAGAALDVTDPEPLPADHPLLDAPGLLIVPHIASATHATRERMADMAVDNVLAGLAGERMPNCANPEVYESGP